MERRRPVLVFIVAIGFAGVLFNAFEPDRFESVRTTVQEPLSDVPTPVVTGAFGLFVVTVWVAAMILLARLLYWGWKQVDEYVFWAWNTVLPESPIIRFAAGITIMLFVFVFGPLVVMHGLDFIDDEYRQQIEANEFTDHINRATATESQSFGSENNTTNQNNRIYDSYNGIDIKLRAKDPYL
jgi:hypothetical protein